MLHAQKIPLTIYLAVVTLVPVMPVDAQSVPIAILDFEANGVSESEATALTDRLRNDMIRTGKFEVLERAFIANIVEGLDFQLAGCTSTNCLIEIGRLIGAAKVVGGRISLLGTIYTVSAIIVDVATGEVITVSDYDQTGGFEQMLTLGMRGVARRLANQTGVDIVARTEVLGDAEKPIVEPIDVTAVIDTESDQETPRPVIRVEDIMKGIIDPAALQGWNVAIGFGTMRGINLVTVSSDRVINKEMTVFAAFGFGPYPLTLGLINHSNRGGSGKVRAAVIGMGLGVSVYGFWGKQWSLEENGAVIAGVIGGLNLTEGLFVIPTVSWEFQF